MNLAYLGIYSSASIKGTFIDNFFNMDMNLQYFTFQVFLTNLCGKGGAGLGIGMIFCITLDSFSFSYLVSSSTSTSILLAISHFLLQST